MVTLHNLGKVHHDIKGCSNSTQKSSQTTQGLTKALEPPQHKNDFIDPVTYGFLDPVAILYWRIYEIN